MWALRRTLCQARCLRGSVACCSWLRRLLLQVPPTSPFFVAFPSITAETDHVVATSIQLRLSALMTHQGTQPAVAQSVSGLPAW